ncbi:hypothetical protein DBB42_11205 [Pseudomonas plecoglossicida]|uniref:Uncharacterized protein n=1 Tax=Pseudomonas plecoglossicida TaxID=70775 RepID=A0A2R7UJK1_PSEDL|nr:hypothetical protein DBB42_11205 [Pseudomonas plecoglossicida]
MTAAVFFTEISTQARSVFCGSGLVSRKGCAAAPAIHAAKLKSRGRFAPLSRHKAAPTKWTAPEKLDSFSQ